MSRYVEGLYSHDVLTDQVKAIEGTSVRILLGNDNYIEIRAAEQGIEVTCHDGRIVVYPLVSNQVVIRMAPR